MASLLPFFQIGFHGAALVFLYLGYQLLKDLQKQNPSTPEALEVFKIKRRSVFAFIGWSFLFFLFGVVLQIVGPRFAGGDGKHPLVVLLNPIKMPGGLPTAKVDLDGAALDLQAGRAEATIAARSDLRINVEDLRDEIEKRLRREQLADAAALPSVGLGDDAAAQSVGLTDQVLAAAAPAEIAAKVAALEQKVEQPAAGEDPAAAKASLGWVQFSLGKDDEAKATLTAAAAEATDPETKTRALQNLSRVLEVQGDVSGAKEALKDVQGEGAQARRITLEKLEATVVRPPG